MPLTCLILLINRVLLFQNTGTCDASIKNHIDTPTIYKFSRASLFSFFFTPSLFSLNDSIIRTSCSLTLSFFQPSVLSFPVDNLLHHHDRTLFRLLLVRAKFRHHPCHAPTRIAISTVRIASTNPSWKRALVGSRYCRLSQQNDCLVSPSAGSL